MVEISKVCSFRFPSSFGDEGPPFLLVWGGDLSQPASGEKGGQEALPVPVVLQLKISNMLTYHILEYVLNLANTLFLWPKEEKNKRF